MESFLSFALKGRIKGRREKGLDSIFPRELRVHDRERGEIHKQRG